MRILKIIAVLVLLLLVATVVSKFFGPNVFLLFFPWLLFLILWIGIPATILYFAVRFARRMLQMVDEIQADVRSIKEVLGKADPTAVNEHI